MDGDVFLARIEQSLAPQPYSPDFNPIEMVFTKLKAPLRAAGARTMPDLWNAIADALKRFTPTECRNYLAAAGYDAT